MANPVSYRVETRTRASGRAAIAAAAVLALAIALPAFAGRSLIQDLFVILTMLTLAQCWNLLAGYAGLVSVGQQAFVGIGAYAMFAGVIVWGWDPVPAILLGGVAAAALAPFSYSDWQGPISQSAPGSLPRLCACRLHSGKALVAAPAPRCHVRRRPT